MSYQLTNINNRLSLKSSDKSAPGAVYVDFIEGTLAHRKKFGGGKNQLIAKAVGIKPKIKLSVLDVTAGLGRDAFVLATLGCDVLMCERSPIIFALLEDGLKRAEKENWFCELSLKLIHADAIQYLSIIAAENKPDVIYIDPMFPERNKSALVKKEMRVLRDVVGDDIDSEQLLNAALSVAKKRVVVKRSKLAPTLTDKKPDIVFMGKSSRFDVYLKMAPALTLGF
jgi:16S rRNA (guanine1516-N2)-methyltransferase